MELQYSCTVYFQLLLQMKKSKSICCKEKINEIKFFWQKKKKNVAKI